MAGSTGSGSRQWVVFLAVAIALIFFNKYLLIGAQAVLGVMLPGGTPLVSQPAVVKTKTPIPAEEVVVEKVITEIVTGVTKTESPTQSIQPEEVSSTTTAISSITRHGGWLDEIIFTVQDPSTAVSSIQNGSLDLYGSALHASEYPNILSAGLNYSSDSGLFYELTFNPSGPVFSGTGEFNPFANPRLREAMNWLIDREYLNQVEFYGSAQPRVLPISSHSPDYADLYAEAQDLERKYAYDISRASQVFQQEMSQMGASYQNGLFTYGGQPITLIFLIRNDGDGHRLVMGDYIAIQLEAIGFLVDRRYVRSSEASQIWRVGNPDDGQWHLFTGSWWFDTLGREADVFQLFYSPDSYYQSFAIWQAYQPTVEFRELGNRLANLDFNSTQERREAMVRALTLAMEDSAHIWLLDGKVFSPWRQGVEAVYDRQAGLAASRVWPLTLRQSDQEGGTLRWGGELLFQDPLNPIAGSTWVEDIALMNATLSDGLLPDPISGLKQALRVESAVVTAKNGLPITATLPWVQLRFAADIPVPGDALVDWDVANQVFIAAAEKYPRGTYANLKSVVVYPADLWETVTFHDGSRLDVADFLYSMILKFDRGKPESTIYDESAAFELDEFLQFFKGFRIVSENPLTIEWYTDAYVYDAENNVVSLWPTFATGEAGWHTLTIASLAEAAGKTAFSQDKADAFGVAWLNLVGTDNDLILIEELDWASQRSYIPYAPTLQAYITPAEAIERYDNLQRFYYEHGHFWVGTGPYLLDFADVTGKVAVLKSFSSYADPTDRWEGYWP